MRDVRAREGEGQRRDKGREMEGGGGVLLTSLHICWRFQIRGQERITSNNIYYTL